MTSIIAGHVYAPVWKNRSITNVDEAFASAGIAGGPLSEVSEKFVPHPNFPNPLTPTEVMTFLSEGAFGDAPENSVWMIPLTDMASVSASDPIEMTIDLDEGESFPFATNEISNSVLYKFFEANLEHANEVPEGSRYCFPPLVHLNNPIVPEGHKGEIRDSMTVNVNVRHVFKDAPVKGWAFVA